MANRTVFVELKAKVDQYTSGLGKAAKSTDAFAKKAKDAQRSAESWSKVGLAGAALGAGVAVLAKKSIDAASDLAETVAKAGTVFGDAAAQVTAFGDTAAEKLGMSKQKAIDAATTFAVFGKAAGLSGSELAGFSTCLTTLAADMASFSNTSPEQAIEAIGAALRGESEPIRAYGVMLDDATLKAEALAQGIYNGTGSLTQQQKVLAAQASILKQTTDAQGDVARTADGFANTQRRLTAEWEDAQAAMGEGLLPAATSAAEVFGGLLKTFNQLPDGVQTAALGVGAVGAAAMIAAPRVVALNAALVETGIVSEGAAGKAGRLAGQIGIIAAVVAGLKVGSDAFRDWTGQVAVGAEESSAAIRQMWQEGQISDQMIRDLGGGVNTLGDALHNNLNMGFAQGAAAAGLWVSSLGGILPWYDEAIPKSEEFFTSLDTGLASMATQSPAAAAQAAAVFQMIAREADAQGISVEKLTTLFPQYSAALQTTGTTTTAVATETGNLADVEGTAAKATRELAAAHKHLDRVLSEGQARDDAIQALKDLKKSLKETGGAIEGNSTAALKNRAQLRQAAQTAGDYAESMKNPKKQAEYLSERIDAIRAALEDAGAKGPEINKILKPLENARAKAAEAAGAAGAMAAALSRIPGTYTAIVTIQERLDKMFAGGGYISGPGSETSDSIPARLSAGEYVVQASAVRRYGRGFLDAVNSGQLVGFASGSDAEARAKARRAARRQARTERADARFEARMARLYADDPVGEARARLEREKKALDMLKKGSAAYIAQQGRIISARSTLRTARRGARTQTADETAAAAASYDAARFESSLRGLSDVDAASARLTKSQQELAGLAQGTAEWYAKSEEVLANQNALTDAQNANLDEAKSKVEQLAQAWTQQVDAVQAALTGQQNLLDSFDFGKMTDAAAELTAAQDDLLAARRALNTASGDDRAAALQNLADAEARVASAQQAKKDAEPTFDNVFAGFQAKMQALSAFRSNIETLAKRGVHPTILQQLISAGVNGGAEMAAALVKFTPEQLGQINATQAQIETDANAIGQISANGLYGDAIVAAQQQLIQISGSQPIQLTLDSRTVYTGLLELARQSGGTLSWTSA